MGWIEGFAKRHTPMRRKYLPPCPLGLTIANVVGSAGGP